MSKRPRGLPVAWRAGLPSFWAALKVRPAAVAERKPFLVPGEERPLDLLADADAVEQVGAGELVEPRRPRPMLRSATPLSRWRWASLLPPVFGFGLERRDAAVEVRCAALCVTHRECDLVALGALANSTRPGSRIGLRKRTSTAKASGRRLSSAARQRALVHMPCAIARGKPSGFAVSECMWIGLRSPETAA